MLEQELCCHSPRLHRLTTAISTARKRSRKRPQVPLQRDTVCRTGNDHAHAPTHPATTVNVSTPYRTRKCFRYVNPGIQSGRALARNHTPRGLGNADRGSTCSRQAVAGATIRQNANGDKATNIALLPQVDRENVPRLGLPWKTNRPRNRLTTRTSRFINPQLLNFDPKGEVFRIGARSTTRTREESTSANQAPQRRGQPSTRRHSETKITYHLARLDRNHNNHSHAWHSPFRYPSTDSSACILNPTPARGRSIMGYCTCLVLRLKDTVRSVLTQQTAARTS